jgi:hypothetical protein
MRMPYPCGFPASVGDDRTSAYRKKADKILAVVVLALLLVLLGSLTLHRLSLGGFAPFYNLVISLAALLIYPSRIPIGAAGWAPRRL